MEQQGRLYPIGIQAFSTIREGDYLYIGKTAHVYRMGHGSSSYVFLCRPRRFGKSLLTSTLHSYSEGRKELFAGSESGHQFRPREAHIGRVGYRTCLNRFFIRWHYS